MHIINSLYKIIGYFLLFSPIIFGVFLGLTLVCLTKRTKYIGISKVAIIMFSGFVSLVLLSTAGINGIELIRSADVDHEPLGLGQPNIPEENVTESNYSKIYLKKGIDVSKYQEEIDWQLVSEDNVDFAMIRLGYRGYEVGHLYLDDFFKDNLSKSLSTNLDIGCYFVSAAISKKEIKEEVDFILDHIKGYRITMPIAIAWGSDETSDKRTYDISINKGFKLMEYFCKLIEESGYEPLIYLDEKNFNNNHYDFKYPLWISTLDKKRKPNINSMKMWQYSDKGKVSGILSNVDLDYYYIK